MELIIGFAALILGAGGGAVSTWTIMRNRPVQVVETNKIVEKMVEVDRNLTETHLLEIPCSTEYIATNGESLCREMFCRMTQRAGNAGSGTSSQKECESISNLINSELILKKCYKELKSDTTGDELRIREENCIRIFEKRK